MEKRGLNIVILWSILVIIGVFVLLFNSQSLTETKNANYGRIIHQTDIQKGKLVFYEKDYPTNGKGIGLALFENNMEKNSIVSNSVSLSNKVTWGVLGTKCGIDCEPIDIIYGTTEYNTAKLKVVMNNITYEPELINTDFKNIWYIIVDNIQAIQSIEAFSSDGKMLYKYPPERNTK
jgi:hypothetical protein